MQQMVFIAHLIARSTCFGDHYAHHQELKSIIQWLLPVVFRAVVFKLLVWCGTEGYASGLQDAAASCSLLRCLAVCCDVQESNSSVKRGISVTADSFVRTFVSIGART